MTLAPHLLGQDMMATEKWIMRALLAMLLILLGAASPSRVAAQERALHWDRYDVEVQVLENGDLRMTETQVIVVDQGTFRTGSRSFDTGEFGRVRSVEVREAGAPYRRGADEPGTFTASDDGQRFTLNYVFRDASATEHTMTIAYTVGRALVASENQARLEWNFLCAAEDCPTIEASTLTVRLPRGVAPTAVTANASGAPMRQTQNGAILQWELTEPVQGRQARLAIDFPRSSLAAGALFRSGSQGAPQEQPRSNQPGAPQTPLPAPGVAAPAGISPLFCLVMIFILFIAFSIMRGSMRRQGYAPTRRGRSSPFGGGMRLPPMGFPPIGRRRRRRGGFGGWGIPPIIPPTFGQRDGGGPFTSPPDATGGGGSSWGDSGGGGSSWGDSGGGGSSWGNTGGGGSSWGGGGGSGGGSGGGGGGSGGGGGGNDKSGFG